MGAYDNPQQIKFNQPTSVGQGWAQTAANIGKQFGAAYERREAALKADLAKENARIAGINEKITKLNDKKQSELKSDLRQLKGLDQQARELYVTEFNKGYKLKERLISSNDPEEQADLRNQIRNFEKFELNAADSLIAADNLVIELQEKLNKVVTTGPGVPNTPDLYYNGNNNLYQAALIEAGGIEEGENREYVRNEDGSIVLKYTVVEDGKTKTFDLDPLNVDLEGMLTVPDVDKPMNKFVADSQVFTEKGEISSNYVNLNEAGQPSILEETITENGKTYLVKSLDVDKKAIIDVYSNGARGAIDNMSYAEKISAYKHIIAPALSNITVKDSGKNEKYKVDTFNYEPDPKTGKFAEGEEAKFNAAVGAYAGLQAEKAFIASTKKYYKKTEVTKKAIKQTAGDVKLKNLSSAFAASEKGDLSRIGLTNNQFIEPVEVEGEIKYKLVNVTAQDKGLSDQFDEPLTLNEIVNMLPDNIDKAKLRKSLLP